MSEIYFAQIREDSKVERLIAQTVKPGKIICVGSGGCTAFSLLTDFVQTITCVDNNPAQCALIELKKVGIKQLSRMDFLKFIGEEETDDRLHTFENLKNELPEYALKFWTEHPGKIETGINKCGITEQFYRFISESILNTLYGKQVWEKLFACTSIDEQKEMYATYFSTESWIKTIRILLSKEMHLKFFPAFMFEHAATDDFSNFFLRKFEQEITTKPVADNYFLSQFVLQKYLPKKKEGMPYYLTEEGYTAAKRNIQKLTIACSDLASVCIQAKEIDCFMLSNVFDWMNEQQRRETAYAINHSKSGKAFLFYRNMFASMEAGNYFPKAKHDKPFSQTLFETERSMMYNNLSFLEL